MNLSTLLVGCVVILTSLVRVAQRARERGEDLEERLRERSEESEARVLMCDRRWSRAFGDWRKCSRCVLVFAAAAGALAGCSSGEVVVPARQTAENWQTDTVRVATPPPLAPAGTGRVAAPARVEHYDRSRANGPAPFDVSEIQLDRDTLTVRSPRATRHFRAPAVGETLRVRREPSPSAVAGEPADTAGRVTGRVDGRPTPDTVRVEGGESSEEDAGVGEKLASLPAWVLAVLVTVVATVLIFFFRIFR